LKDKIKNNKNSDKRAKKTNKKIIKKDQTEIYIITIENNS
jgi:hypothetical protein